MLKTKAGYEHFIFVNCPFDEEYVHMLWAIIFAIYRCGFFPRCALEEDNALQNRLDKIRNIIAACRYGIHDISRTGLCGNNLPRFNMPFELGLFFGAKYYGSGTQKDKNALVFDAENYRYQKFISDLNGVDIKAHENDPRIVIKKVRDWLQAGSLKVYLPGYLKILSEYQVFLQVLPKIASDFGLNVENISFYDFCFIVEQTCTEELHSINQGRIGSSFKS